MSSFSPFRPPFAPDDSALARVLLERSNLSAATDKRIDQRASGLIDAIRSQAVETLRLSSLTLPHALARVLLAEQLYRAWSINAGHPYHRE